MTEAERQQVIDAQREAFEAWAKINWSYFNGRDDAYAVWQAATAAERERAAKVCEQHPEGSSYQLRPRLAAAIRKG